MLVCAAAIALAAGCAGRETRVRGTEGMEATSVVSPVGGRVPAGTTIWLTLDERISAEDSQVGDRFTARVAQDIVSPDGEMLIPRGARVEGRIVELRESERAGDPAVVGLELQSIEIGGTEQPLTASIVETEVPGRRPGIRGRDVAIGAAIGAVLGGVTEGMKGAVVGGALGAGAGTLISLGTGDAPAELPTGTQMAMRLERPVLSLAAIRGGRRVE